MSNNNRKIAYVVPMGRGLDTFVYREIEALNERGVDIVLFSTKFAQGDVFAPKPEWEYHVLSARKLALLLPWLLIKALLKPGVLMHAIKTGGMLDLLFALYYVPHMRRAGVDQIHCHFGDHKLFIGYFCKLLSGLPLTVTIHAHEFYTNPNDKLFRTAVKQCDRVFPIAQRWCDKLIAEYGCDPDRVVLNRLFVDTDLYKPSNSLLCISVGRFTERKGFHYLMQAIPQLMDLDIHFAFVGFGDLDLNAMAAELGVAERVTVFEKLGYRELLLLYQKADMYCLPSITTEQEGAEGIPVVLMEAMGAGLPVVSTPSGATDELVEEILVEERSVEQLVQGLRRLAENPDLRRQQGERNRDIVKQKFSVSNVDKFLQGLDQTLESHRRHG